MVAGHDVQKWKAYARDIYAPQWRLRVKDYALKEREYHQHVLSLINPQPGRLILECGIGTGEPLALEVARRGHVSMA